MDPRRPAHCELRFLSLFNAGCSYAFPCDAAGKVDLDSLSSKARENYFYARTLIGREFAHPTVTSIPSFGPGTDCSRPPTRKFIELTKSRSSKPTHGVNPGVNANE
jgi:hypothetical protein